MPIQFNIRDESNTSWINILTDKNIVITPVQDNNFVSNNLHDALHELKTSISNIQTRVIPVTGLPIGGVWNLTSELLMSSNTNTYVSINTNNTTDARLYFKRAGQTVGSIGSNAIGEFTLNSGTNIDPYDIKLGADRKLYLANGTGVSGISLSATLNENSDDYLSTQKAIKSYVDGSINNIYNSYDTANTGMFHIGTVLNNGPILKNNSGVLELRNPSDNSYADFKCRNFTVTGGLTTIESTVVKIADNVITLNSNMTSGSPSGQGGMEILRGSAPKARLVWDETLQGFIGGPEGSELPISPTFSTVVSPEVVSNTSGKVGVATSLARSDHSHNLGNHNHTTSSGGLLTGDHNINAATASKWQTQRLININGVVKGSGYLDGSGDISITTTTNNLTWADYSGLNLKVQLAGDLVGSSYFDSTSAIATIDAQVNNDSHTHKDSTLVNMDWGKLLNIPSPSLTFAGTVTGTTTFQSLNSAVCVLSIDDGTY